MVSSYPYESYAVDKHIVKSKRMHSVTVMTVRIEGLNGVFYYGNTLTGFVLFVKIGSQRQRKLHNANIGKSTYDNVV